MLQQPGMLGPICQPLLQQPVQPYYQPSYSPLPLTVVPAAAPTVITAPASGPVQNNAACQSVVINQPGSSAGRMQRLLVDPEGVRGWSTGLLGCLNDIASSNRMKECAFICCAIPGGFTAMRVKLRTIGGIKGNICEDCLVVHVCPLCAICQMSRELDSMGL